MSGHQMHLHLATCREVATNTHYPRCARINSLEDLRQAVAYDHIAPTTKGDRRGEGCFISADCIQLDLDNTHNEGSDTWKTIDDVMDVFPDVEFYAIQSRNYMKPKRKEKRDGTVITYEPREKYHFYFPLSFNVDFEGYEKNILTATGIFPFFDPAAVGQMQPFFGVEHPQGQYIEGNTTLDEFIRNVCVDDVKAALEEFEGVCTNKDVKSRMNQVYAYFGIQTPGGQQGGKLDTARDSLSWVGDVMQRRRIKWLEKWAEQFGVDLGASYSLSEHDAVHPGAVAICVACPWEEEHSEEDQSESATVILVDKSGQLNFLCRHSHDHGWREYRAEIERRAGIEGRSASEISGAYLPEVFSDVGQGKLFADVFGENVAYSPDMKSYLRYDGIVWRADDTRVHGQMQELTRQQLKESGELVMDAKRAELKAEELNNQGEKQQAHERLEKAEKYRKYARQQQNSTRIKNALTEARPQLVIGIRDLDFDPYLLNTPSGVIDLKTGILRAHSYKDYCTRVTGCSANSINKELFADFLDKLTGSDLELQEYLQNVMGMAAAGVILQEGLIIAYGDGGNGKSTFFNLAKMVLGDYAVSVPSEIFVTSANSNKKPAMALLRGARLAIAPELEEGQRLDTGIVKMLCSTDDITAEPKYQNPFTFKPSHTMVLYTNHLPKVGSMDDGIWRRIYPIHFKNKFSGTPGEIKNYAEYLFSKCGGAALTWIVEGAKRFLAAGGKIEEPAAVKEAKQGYRDNSDWLAAFLEECCEIGPGFDVQANKIQKAYKEYCAQTGDYQRNSSDFKTALENAGFKMNRNGAGRFYHGLRVVDNARFEPCIGNTPFDRQKIG